MTTLTDLLPRPSDTPPDPDAIFSAFADWAKDRGLPLYPHQEEALIEVVMGSNVILSTPTGSGKSLVATGAHFTALANGQRSYYTAPIKALVSEKFFALIDILPWGRQEEWLDSPEGWPSRPTYSGWLDSPDIARAYGPKDNS